MRPTGANDEICTLLTRKHQRCATSLYQTARAFPTLPGKIGKSAAGRQPCTAKLQKIHHKDLRSVRVRDATINWQLLVAHKKAKQQHEMQLQRR
jgi:hypothetical protein